MAWPPDEAPAGGDGTGGRPDGARPHRMPKRRRVGGGPEGRGGRVRDCREELARKGGPVALIRHRSEGGLVGAFTQNP